MTVVCALRTDFNGASGMPRPCRLSYPRLHTLLAATAVSLSRSTVAAK